ncbi:MAG TPA: tetratricopeptide repeat protein [Chthoniobacterales bacterium]|nr:tetratricopeptide repeat protein [Chthoniobacterales bacterium]
MSFSVRQIAFALLLTVSVFSVRSRAESTKPDYMVPFEKGVAAQRAKNWKEAIEQYTRSLKLFPGFIQALHNRGAAKAGMEDFDGAIADFTKAIALDPRSAACYGGRAKVNEEKGKYEVAVADCTRAITLTKDEAFEDIHGIMTKTMVLSSAYLVRAKSYYGLKLYSKSLSDCDKAIEIAPNDAEAWIQRALVKVELGDLKGSESDAAKAKSLAGIK